MLAGDSGVRWKRVLAAWLLIIAAESVHGALRQWLLAPMVGDFRARQAGVFTGSLIIFIIAFLLIRWVGMARTRQLLAVGVLWTALTLGFEFALGRALGFGWDRILADYNLARGGLMPVGMVVLLLTPYAAAKARAWMDERRLR